MAEQGRGSPVLGGALLVLGVLLVVLAFLPGANLADLAGIQLADQATQTMAQAGLGVLLVLLGLVLIRPVVQRARAMTEVAPAPAAPPKPTKQTSPPPARRKAPAPQPMEVLTTEEIELHDLDRRIKDVTRRINQARVKLGTGKLSPEGYHRIVEDLEDERANLEKRRVDLELEIED